MSTDITANLRLANSSLRAWLVRLRAEPMGLTEIQAKDLHDLLAELLRASGALQSGRRESPADAELEAEIAEYRSHLEALSKVLPNVQGRLLAERARLQIEQAQLAARKAWAEASRRTF